jgi:hypothetical protein
MTLYNRKADNVNAEQIQSPLGDLAQPGDYLVRHSDGSVTVMPADAFHAEYEPAPDPVLAADVTGGQVTDQPQP